MLVGLRSRLSELEARRPTEGLARMIDANDFDPVVHAIWLAVGIAEMNLFQPDLLVDRLNRFRMKRAQY